MFHKGKRWEVICCWYNNGGGSPCHDTLPGIAWDCGSPSTSSTASNLMTTTDPPKNNTSLPIVLYANTNENKIDSFRFYGTAFTTGCLAGYIHVATYLVMSFSYNILAVAHIQASVPRTPLTGGVLGLRRPLFISTWHKQKNTE